MIGSYKSRQGVEHCVYSHGRQERASDEDARSYWILELVVSVFGALERLIPQKVLCRDTTDDATDKWILGNMLLSMACFVLYSVLNRIIGFSVPPAPVAAAIGLIHGDDTGRRAASKAERSGVQFL